jgi:hypothetical protein
MYFYFYFLLTALAIWRISSLLAREDGLFDIFLRIRHYVGVRYDDKSETYGTNTVSKGILCVWCSSLWFTPFASLLFATDPVEWLIYTLSLSTIVILFESTITRLS